MNIKTYNKLHRTFELNPGLRVLQVADYKIKNNDELKQNGQHLTKKVKERLHNRI